MRQVCTATPYVPGNMHSMGRARYMLICQFQFPDTFEENEIITFVDSDRIDRDHARHCYEKYMKSGGADARLESWAKTEKMGKVFDFLKEIMNADPNVSWTGFRIMGTVNAGNGHPIWSFELFAKSPNSSTKLYTGPNAPNVQGF